MLLNHAVFFGNRTKLEKKQQLSLTYTLSQSSIWHPEWDYHYVHNHLAGARSPGRHAQSHGPPDSCPSVPVLCFLQVPPPPTPAADHAAYEPRSPKMAA